MDKKQRLLRWIRLEVSAIQLNLKRTENHPFPQTQLSFMAASFPQSRFIVSTGLSIESVRFFAPSPQSGAQKSDRFGAQQDTAA
jgi:hypothetical protein